MMLVNVVTWACLSLMVIGLASVIYNLITKPRAERIKYVRNFKKGKGVLIYVVAIPLLWVGIGYTEPSVLDAFFGAVRRIVDLIVLKYDVGAVKTLALDNKFYAVAIYFCFILVGLNALMFAMSLASQQLWNYRTNLFFRFSPRGKLVIFGNISLNRLIYKSEQWRAKLLVDRITDKAALALYTENIAYTQIASVEDYICRLLRRAARNSRETVVVINNHSDEANIELGRYFIEHIGKFDKASRESCFGRLRIYLFGDPRYEAIYEDIIADGLGCITYVNKYQKVAIDFIDKYPFTRFMSEEHVDYSTSLLKDGVEINALMIGFGKTNQQIFLTSVANNQFMTAGANGVELKPVRYHIFDKNHAENNKNLNHTYNRYRNECEDANPDDYLPLPTYPADDKYYYLDVNDVEFYNGIRRIVTASPLHVNFIIIAFGTDLENIDMAGKLLAKAKEWGVKNLTVFVKVREDYKGSGLLDEDNCYIIANESQVVYSIDNIMADGIFKMAQLRNEIYDLEFEITDGGDVELAEQRVAEIKKKARRNWYLKKTQAERDSSLYCCLSLRMKLNLMNLDYRPKSDSGEGLSNEEYLSVYAGSDRPDNTYYKVKADGKDIIRYTLSFAESRRKTMAIHEHLRWNSFMISKGMIPATREQILSQTVPDGDGFRYTNGKSYTVRHHGNITTFDGLVEFRRMVAKRDGVSEDKKDVIKYDYQLLDDAYWLLDMTGHKIVRREK